MRIDTAHDHLLVDSTGAVRPCAMARPAEQPFVPRTSPAEELITLTEAARRLPKIDGKKVAISTLWRWCRNGLRGERLEYVRLGRKICTTPEALQRFFTRLVELDERVPPDTRSLPPGLKRSPVTSKQRQKALAEADEVMKRAGI